MIRGPPSATDWEPLGGVFSSPPTCTSVGDLNGGAKIVVAGLGTDNQAFLKVFDRPGSRVWRDRAGSFARSSAVSSFKSIPPQRAEVSLGSTVKVGAFDLVCSTSLARMKE